MVPETSLVDPDQDVIVVANAGPLSGRVVVPGAKNSVLKLMAACLLADGTYTLTNVPRIVDVEIMSELLGTVGLRISAQPAPQGEVGQHLTIVNDGNISTVAPFEVADRIRASVNLVGPLISRFGHIDIGLPGGDDFGGRPIDMHLRGLEAMGATFEVVPEGIIGRCDRLQGAHIEFEFPSVGATENIVMAAVLAAGETIINNAAREPEIVDLCNMLRKMGAHIDGIGSSRLVITGVTPGTLQAVSHEVVTDRVQSATYAAAVAMCGGDIVIERCVPEHMEMLLHRFADMGVTCESLEGGMRVSCEGQLHSVDVSTLPYPGVATDYKPLIVAMLSIADGTGIVTENLYPGRFKYVLELQKLGADIQIDGHHAIVRGVPRLRGATVNAPDIRAGAALVVAGMSAHGITEIRDIHHIDRGYDDIVGRMAGLGASISRIPLRDSPVSSRR